MMAGEKAEQGASLLAQANIQAPGREHEAVKLAHFAGDGDSPACKRCDPVD